MTVEVRHAREGKDTDDQSSDGSERRDDLVYGGICPVCDEEFIDGYGELEEGEFYNARICVDEIDGGGEGKMLVHLTGGDEFEEAMYWTERELREARQALWDGKSGKAFTAIEAAQDEFETVKQSLSPATDHFGGEPDA